jgi:hypothetical protein
MCWAEVTSDVLPIATGNRFTRHCENSISPDGDTPDNKNSPVITGHCEEAAEPALSVAEGPTKQSLSGGMRLLRHPLGGSQ